MAAYAGNDVTGVITGGMVVIQAPVGARTFVVDGITNPITAGTASNVRVIAMQAGVIDTTYTGTIHFTSTDPMAVLPPNYTFVAGDAGVHTFLFHRGDIEHI